MIPSKFLQRMATLLPEAEYEAFVTALEEPPVRGLRVNTLKTDAEAVLPLLPFGAAPLPFAENGFYATEDKVGALPCHHAGMIYMQDPGAMSAVAAAAPKSGMTVLDLCAAPGGKSTQLAAAISPDGVLVCNEYVPSRAKILQGNVERMGCRSAIVTNLSCDQLADFYGPVFDLVVCDAPCSGEGMLRKYEVAGEEWSEENVALCATRQREILDSATRLVAPGGRLLYSTCTFAPEENEQNVAWLLNTYPEFSLIPVADAIANATADGVATESHPELALCRRFYPHVSPGEGQFVALLQKSAEAEKAPCRADNAKPLSKKEAETVWDFLRDTLETLPDCRLVQLREDIYLAPDIPIPPRGVYAAGVCVGTLQKGRVVPHHQLFSAYGSHFRRKVNLKADDGRVLQYLRGEEIALTAEEGASGGYAALLFEGAPLGGGKIVGERLKNHYPKGLRNKT